jgi:hypothetical protein
MWQVDTYLVVNMGTLVQLLLSFSYFKSILVLQSFTAFHFVSFVLFRFASFCFAYFR